MLTLLPSGATLKVNVPPVGGAPGTSGSEALIDNKTTDVSPILVFMVTLPVTFELAVAVNKPYTSTAEPEVENVGLPTNGAALLAGSVSIVNVA
jgi:hypothetical protein